MPAISDLAGRIDAESSAVAVEQKARNLRIAGIAAVLVLLGAMSRPPAAEAQYYGGVYNPYTGRYAAGAAGYNPYTGRVGAGGVAVGPYGGATAARQTYNPYTGRNVTRGVYHNPMTGNTGAYRARYNPYTGRGAVRVRR